MKRFYRIKKNGKERFYTGLKNLCESEGLNYANVHYSITRSGKGRYEYEDVKAETLYFEKLKNERNGRKSKELN